MAPKYRGGRDVSLKAGARSLLRTDLLPIYTALPHVRFRQQCISGRGSALHLAVRLELCDGLCDARRLRVQLLLSGGATALEHLVCVGKLGQLGLQALVRLLERINVGGSGVGAGLGLLEVLGEGLAPCERQLQVLAHRLLDVHGHPAAFKPRRAAERVEGAVCGQLLALVCEVVRDRLSFKLAAAAARA
eukprot:6200643-Pleurochrysis_carterae.AAC.3